MLAEAVNAGPAEIAAAQLADDTCRQFMMYLKRQYFTKENLTIADYVGLGLAVPSTGKPGSVGIVPNLGAVTEAEDNGAARLRLLLAILGRLPSGYKRSNVSFSGYFAIVDPEKAAAGIPGYIPGDAHDISELTERFFSKGVHFVLTRQASDRGKKIWFGVKLMNPRMQEGDPGPLFSTIIP
jgi:hypothetical protein